jgi:hypothetical protein
MYRNIAIWQSQQQGQTDVTRHLLTSIAHQLVPTKSSELGLSFLLVGRKATRKRSVKGPVTQSSSSITSHFELALLRHSNNITRTKYSSLLASSPPNSNLRRQ